MHSADTRQAGHTQSLNLIFQAADVSSCLWHLVSEPAWLVLRCAGPDRTTAPRRLAKKVVFDKIRSALGVVKCMVSGGGSLSNHLDDFYEVLGLPVVNGWGLSEVRPGLASCQRTHELL